jgi:molybdopterin molybdotransferase
LQGEDLRTGDLVLPAGTLLKPQHIAMLAAVGATRPLVYCRPRVGVLSTGSELVSPDVEPDISQIRNSNGPQLQAQVEKAGGTACFYGIVPDDEHAIRDAILKSVEENDLTLVSGGVSVGDFDFVPQVIRELGFEIHFNRLLVKPGQHTTFASKGTKYIIGLPEIRVFIYSVRNICQPFLFLFRD